MIFHLWLPRFMTFSHQLPFLFSENGFSFIHFLVKIGFLFLFLFLFSFFFFVKRWPTKYILWSWSLERINIIVITANQELTQLKLWITRKPVQVLILKNNNNLKWHHWVNKLPDNLPSQAGSCNYYHTGECCRITQGQLGSIINGQTEEKRHAKSTSVLML